MIHDIYLNYFKIVPTSDFDYRTFMKILFIDILFVRIVRRCIELHFSTSLHAIRTETDLVVRLSQTLNDLIV